MPSPRTPIVTLFGVNFNAVSFVDAVETLAAQVGERPAKVVVTPNVDHVVSLSELPEVKKVYTTADYAFADGMPVVWVSRWLKRPLPERVTGADLFVALCAEAQARAWRIAVLGGMPGQEPMLLERFAHVFPGLKVSLLCPPMGFDYQSAQADEAVAWVNRSQVDIVFVCLGFPRQSLWSLRNRARLDTSLVLCVGASMEFALGLKSRAPLWMQKSGLEWAWRLASDPAKLWRRYLVRGPRFARLAWKERQTMPSAK